MELTEVDRAILRVVQQDAGLTIIKLAERVGVSSSVAQRRLQRLRDEKVILRDVSVVDPRLVGAAVTLLVELYGRYILRVFTLWFLSNSASTAWIHLNCSPSTESSMLKPSELDSSWAARTSCTDRRFVSLFSQRKLVPFDATCSIQ